MLLLDVLEPVLDVAELVVPARLPIRALLALVLLVQRRAPEAALVVRDDRDALGGVHAVRPLVPRDVLGEAVHEEQDCLRERRRVRAGVEVVDREDGEDNSCQVIASGNLIDDRPDYFGKGF